MSEQRRGPINTNVLVCNGCKHFVSDHVTACTHPTVDNRFKSLFFRPVFVKDEEVYVITPKDCPELNDPE